MNCNAVLYVRSTLIKQIIYGQMVLMDLTYTGKAGSFLHGFILTGKYET